jgi:type IV secretory pathway TraG/TraD family ATPase VirD4
MSIPKLPKKTNSLTKINRETVIISVVFIFLAFFLAKMIDEFTFDREISMKGVFVSCTVLGLYFWLAIVTLKKLATAREPAANSKRVQDDHGSARWGPFEEFERVNGHAKANDPGLVLGPNIVRVTQGHLMTIAAPGQGKGTCYIIPNLLRTPFGSYVVTDPKGENACITARAQKGFGQRVIILDPWDEQKQIKATHGIPASGLNPFDFLKDDMDELRDNCELIANFLVPDNPNVKDPYWNDRARTLIRTLLMHIVTGCPEEEHNFWTLYKMLRYSEEKWLNLLLDMQESKDELVSIAAEEFIGLANSVNTIAGIKSSAQNATTVFESPQLRRSLEKSDFNPYDLTNGNCTVYIVVPERRMDTHTIWLRLVIGLMLKACNAKPNKRVIFMLDEFAILGKMPDIQRAYAYSRGQNIFLWVFVQTLSQVKQIYGEEGLNSFLGATGVLIAFGVRDEFTKEYISKSLGISTQMKAQKSFGESGSSVSFQTYQRRLLTPDEVEAETTNSVIIIADSVKYFGYKVPYYKSLYEIKMTYMPDELNAEERELIKKGKMPIDYNHEQYMKLADPRPR